VTSFSLVVTVNRSVLRSSTVRLAGRGFPEADRLCAGLVKPGCGERPLRESAWVALEAAPARGLWLPSLSVVPLVRLSEWLESLEDIMAITKRRRHLDYCVLENRNVMSTAMRDSQSI
jgi:hypothetical protein